VRMVGGDQDEVVAHVADLYIQRRDALRAAGSAMGVTISALTNQDAADISRAVRERLKARGELGQEEVVHPAIDQRGETYDLPIATGDKVRLFRKTYSLIEGKPGFIGANGDVVEVVGQSVDGLQLRDADGRVGAVQWRALKDSRSDRLLLGFGHALTIDSAQGITSGEHINALPRGTAGITAFKSYVAESRHVSQVYTVISEAAAFEAVKRSRAVGDKEPITTGHLWEQVAKDMSDKPYKSLALDLVEAIERNRKKEVDRFIRTEHRVFAQRAAGRDHAGELRKRQRDAEVRACWPSTSSRWSRPWSGGRQPSMSWPKRSMPSPTLCAQRSGLRSLLRTNGARRNWPRRRRPADLGSVLGSSAVVSPPWRPGRGGPAPLGPWRSWRC